MTGFWLDDEPEKTWTLKDIYDDLGTITDVAADLDITIWRMHMWIKRKERVKCPEPIRTIGSTHVYSMQEWRDWFQRWSTNPSRVRWQERSKPNGSGLPFLQAGGADRASRHRKPKPEE